jgi:hypothetical protein
MLATKVISIKKPLYTEYITASYRLDYYISQFKKSQIPTSEASTSK